MQCPVQRKVLNQYKTRTTKRIQKPPAHFLPGLSESVGYGHFAFQPVFVELGHKLRRLNESLPFMIACDRQKVGTFSHGTEFRTVSGLSDRVYLYRHHESHTHLSITDLARLTTSRLAYSIRLFFDFRCPVSTIKL